MLKAPGKTTINCAVNGTPQTLHAYPMERLFDVLREQSAPDRNERRLRRRRVRRGFLEKLKAMHTSLKQTAAVLAIVLAVATAISAQQNSSPAERVRVIKYQGDMASLLATLAQQYDVVVGLETDPKKPRSEVTLDLHDVNCRDMLNGIVQSEPRYQWRENGGRIEVFPVSGALSLLDTPLASFQVKDVNRDLAINRLLGLPEVRAQSLSMNLKPRPPNPSPERIKDEKLSFDLSGVTLRQALNRIARDSGAKFWVFRQYPDGSFEVTLACC